jgi:CheY-like chemotaxis protein
VPYRNEKEMTVIGEALDGIEAIDFIKNNDIPDIIIMDCMLNKLNGIETTRLIIKYNSK